MSTESSYHWRKQLMWGLAIIALGLAFFLDRLEIIEVNQLWHYWPVILVIMGINKMIGYPTAKDFTSGLWMLFIGLWLFAVFEHMFGLTFRNAWPLPIIFAGVAMILEPFIKGRLAGNTGVRDEK